MSRSAVRVLVFASIISVAAGQREWVPQPYEVDEAYRVYEAVVRHEGSYSFARGTLVVQLETDSSVSSTQGCVREDAAGKFKAAGDDFSTVNSKGWVLLSKLKIGKPYELVSSKEIQQYFKEVEGGQISTNSTRTQADSSRFLP